MTDTVVPVDRGGMLRTSVISYTSVRQSCLFINLTALSFMSFNFVVHFNRCTPTLSYTCTMAIDNVVACIHMDDKGVEFWAKSASILWYQAKWLVDGWQGNTMAMVPFA